MYIPNSINLGTLACFLGCRPTYNFIIPKVGITNILGIVWALTLRIGPAALHLTLNKKPRVCVDSPEIGGVVRLARMVYAQGYTYLSARQARDRKSMITDSEVLYWSIKGVVPVIEAYWRNATSPLVSIFRYKWLGQALFTTKKLSIQFFNKLSNTL